MTTKQKLYKYIRHNRDPEQLEEMLKDGIFHFADWRKLNDPMEGYFRYYIKHHTNAEIEKIVDGKDEYGVCCFSMTSADILMWTYYAGNHKGICIEVDSDIGRSEEVTIHTVQYEKQIPWLKTKKGNLRNPRELLLRKIEIWAHEKEMRAMCNGKEKHLKVGTISKVVLGVDVDPKIERIVRDCVEDNLIVYARVDFKENKIRQTRVRPKKTINKRFS